MCIRVYANLEFILTISASSMFLWHLTPVLITNNPYTNVYMFLFSEIIISQDLSSFNDNDKQSGNDRCINAYKAILLYKVAIFSIPKIEVFKRVTSIFQLTLYWQNINVN